MQLEQSHAWKTPGSHRTWIRLLESAYELRGVVREEVRIMVTKVMTDETMVDAVRSRLTVSNRHVVTRRDAFNYLENTYRVAVECDQKEASWTTVLHLWPSSKSIYVLLEQSGLMNMSSLLWAEVPNMKDFSLPGPTPVATTVRRKRWQEVFAMGEFHYELPICTLEVFKEFAGYATQD